jgi:hypothetical protein
MKIYFTASIRGFSEFGKFYNLFYKKIESLGHTNLDNIVLEGKVDNIYEDSHEGRTRLYKETINKIKASDIVILEVSIHSLSMGYVMDRALEMGKPVIALYSQGFDPYFASGILNDKLQVVKYNEDNWDRVLTDAIEYAQENIDTRFNFFLPPSLSYYLDWISQNRKIPRSVYLRKLIETDLESNTEYNQ